MISIFLFVGGSKSRAPINPGLFKLSDPTAVDRVLMESSAGRIELSYQSGYWRVNDTLTADRNLIDVLFATVEQAVPKRTVASRIKDSVIDSLEENGIRVSFYVGQEIQKRFIVWGDATAGLTYFSEQNNIQPYVMVIPGYRVQVSGIFEQKPNTWRDKRIFNFNWRNFKSLKAEFPRDPKQDFEVAMTGRFFSLVNEPKIDTTALNNFLDAVSLINADQFYEVGESSMTDSLIKTTPIMIIEVKDVADKTYSLKVFEISQGQRNAIAQWENDYVLFDRRNILQLYKKKKDFIK